MDTQAHFTAFLDNTVNLKQWKLNLLDSRVTSIVNAIQADEVFEELYKEHLPQGSWAHETIINPVVDGDEFDADFLLHLTEVPEWNDDPARYLRELRAAFKRHSTYKTMVRRKNRCVRIGYSNDCHVDVVPYLTLSDGREVIVRYDTSEFEDTNPHGFTEWMRERDDLTGGNLRKVIRLMKYVRDSKHTFDCKSVILTTLLGGRVLAVSAQTRYADISTTLVTLLEDLRDWLDQYQQMPNIDDPSCPGTNFNHRWDEPLYQSFKTCIGRYAGWAREALDASADGDDAAALAAWQRLFGSEFVAVEVIEKSAALTVSGGVPGRSTQFRSVAAKASTAPNEEFIEAKGYRFTPRYNAVIEARTSELHGFRHRVLRGHRAVPPGSSIKFTLKTDAPPGAQIIWKVRNFGPPAGTDLRGQLIMNSGLHHTERARYRGEHWIEAYVVVNGVVVASDHHNVRIG